MRVSPTSLEPFSGPLRELGAAVRASTLEPLLKELVKVRVSQINRCAYCLDMHTKDAVALGEDEQRLHVLAAWSEAPGFSDRERAALAWAEALTLLPKQGAPADLFARLQDVFDEAEIAALTAAVAEINAWNRLMVGVEAEAGRYVSRHSTSR
jgi:AhpD family alkylhydroperoxidase